MHTRLFGNQIGIIQNCTSSKPFGHQAFKTKRDIRSSMGLNSSFGYRNASAFA